MTRITNIHKSDVKIQLTAQMSLKTTGTGLFEFTDDIRQWAKSHSLNNGLLCVFCQHTSASLTIQENADPDVQKDILTSLDYLAPRHNHYIHSYEGPDDMPAHIKTMLTGSSLTLPVIDGKLALGTWQGVYLLEHRDAGHSRYILLHYIGN
ncbi:secondary thiamine-phosphate synthase enzyme YjbQ [Microvirga sp. W0021]|uniref:Secondary thiamine-phosphate synthase enzyme YjbQ n=1 Tax=Hohaiivirga grylli TaxID=3133970 RepID=A0ABV0BHY8_9HYPH